MSVTPDRLLPPLNRLFKMAVWAGAETAVRLHLARGDDPNARDDDGLTPLMIAAARNRSIVCRLLIDAGADLAAVDPVGRTALEIAVASGAEDAAETIDLALAAQFPVPGSSREEVVSVAAGVADSRSAGASELPLTNGAVDKAITGESAPEIPDVEANTSRPPDGGPPIRTDFEDNGEPLDLSGWEAEEAPVPPVNDRNAALAHASTQEAIAQHTALDNSADWADFEADLPAHAAPLLRVRDAEGRAEIRTLLLRATREGSVPALLLEDVCRDVNGARDLSTESLVGMVLNDLGAETDERFEFRNSSENFEAYVDANESASETETVDDALGYLDNLTSKHNEPIRLYMREAQRTSLLTAEEEAVLGESMERAAGAAIDALACWPGGIKYLASAISSAHQGERSVNSIVSSVVDLVDSDGFPTLDDGYMAITGSSGSVLESSAADEDEQPAQAAHGALAVGLYALGDYLSSLEEGFASSRCDDIRARMSTLLIRRAFLIELSHVAEDGTPEGQRFAHAIHALMLPRGRMISANVRLVISLAKKHVYSGVPLGDLIQDGNIGLINAVDKFDWRRGFRFSTMATWWIRQQITRSIADSSLAIRLPVHVFEIAQRFPDELEALEKDLDHLPTIRQLAERVGHDPGKVELLLRACSAGLPVESLDEEASLDTGDHVDPFERLSAAQMCQTLDALLGELGDRPRKILRLRYGIGDADPLTLEEVGELFDVTRERIRQIEAKALGKLRHPSRLSRLGFWSLDPEKSAAAAGESPNDNIDSGDAPTSFTPRPKPVSTASRNREAVKRGKSQTPLEKVLSQASALGIPVEQTMQGEESVTWVGLTKATDNRHRKLIRSLLGMGFGYWPGKGYRR